MNTVEQIRKRMAAGAPIDGDLAWCRQRLKALQHWPEALDESLAAEVDTLVQWVEIHALPERPTDLAHRLAIGAITYDEFRERRDGRA